MTTRQWDQLLAILRGETTSPLPTAFIIDCPWLPNWHGVNIADYLGSETLWLEAHRHALETFPDTWFLPGFWSEFGMCTEPSAFGTRCQFPRNEFPYAEPVVTDLAQIDTLPTPDPATDGLLPFMLGRLRWAEPSIKALGHEIKFSVSRGPLNVATFLLGTTEFLVALKTDPEPVHRLLRRITDFLLRWHALQRRTFPTIDGIFILDDIVGFLSEADFLEFGRPYLQELYAPPAAVKFFHNDAACAQSIRHYADIGINLYNPGVQTSLAEMRRLCDRRLTLLGTIPPRDVLAQGTPATIRAAVRQLLTDHPDRTRLIPSCAGGMPPGVGTENIQAFCAAVRTFSP